MFELTIPPECPPELALVRARLRDGMTREDILSSVPNAEECLNFIDTEQARLDPNCNLVVTDNVTGAAIFSLTNDDFWDPPPVAREGKEDLVQRPRSVKPEVLADIVCKLSANDTEKRVLDAFVKKNPHAGPEDPRLLVCTRDGRSTLSRGLVYHLLSLIHNQKHPFLKHFNILQKGLLLGTGTPQRQLQCHFESDYNVTDVQVSPLGFLSARVLMGFMQSVGNLVLDQDLVQNEDLKDSYGVHRGLPDTKIPCLEVPLAGQIPARFYMKGSIGTISIENILVSSTIDGFRVQIKYELDLNV